MLEVEGGRLLEVKNQREERKRGEEDHFMKFRR